MGMGYSSNSVSIITVENMEKLLPRQMKKLNSILENNNEDISRTEFFMDFYEFEDTEVMSAYKKLEKAFEKLTAVQEECLTIQPCFHDSNEYGDRYDDVNGEFFIVENVYQYTASAKNFLSVIEDASWVTFG